jgi:tripartite-type tricarboxylate transporter receptor subunit TctC
VKRPIRFAGLLLAAVALSSGEPLAQAQQYPNKPIRMIVPFPPGGATDILARMVAAELAKNWGQRVLVDNRAGASGMVGTELLSKAAPDGYTIGWIISSHLVMPMMMSKVAFDPIKDFVPITLVAFVPDVVCVHPSVPVKNVQELVALMRSKPGQINFASAGSGTSTHLAGELFQITAGVRINHVPYKGGGPAITDLAGGQVHMMFGNATSILPFIRSGRVRALAVTSSERSPALPEVPTVAESGYPKFEVNEWYGVAAPAGTPRWIIDKLNAEIAHFITRPATRDRLTNQLGADVVAVNSDKFALFLKSESEKFAKLIKTANLRLD